MRLGDFPKAILKKLVWVYAYAISPLMGAKCRFYPTCSTYAMEAIEVHGAAKGTVMALRRLAKCHPWHKGEMFDPVPTSIDWAGIIGYKASNPETGCNCRNHKEKI